MKNFIYAVVATVFLAACGSSNTVTKTSEDKALLNAIRKLDKNPENDELKTALKNLYAEAARSHLEKIESYRSETETERWDKIIPEYEALRKLNEVVLSSGVAKKLLNVSDYSTELQQAKQTAAEEYYEAGKSLLNAGDKSSSRNAYYSFRRANELVPNFKDARKQMDTAYKNSTVRVVVNPIRNNSFYYGSIGRNTFGNNFSNDQFQRDLVRDLGGPYNKASNAMFYTDWEARRENIRPDWEIDLTWLELNVPHPITYNNTRNVSRQIEISRDTSGKPLYQTVYATINISRREYTATGDMEIKITDMNTRSSILNTRNTEQYSWNEETATYSGDRRALEGNEQSMLNRRFREPREEEILRELYRRAYPQVRNRIQNAIRF